MEPAPRDTPQNDTVTQTWPLVALLGSLRAVEIAITLWAIGLALWQLLLVDGDLAGFVLFWMLPPLVAGLARLTGTAQGVFRGWAIGYLTLMSVGTLLAESSLFPGFGATHPATTDFATKWNQLDRGSRRLIAWSMTLGGASFFWALGYLMGWAPLHRRRAGRPSELSTPTCYLALFACWLLPGVVLVFLVLSTLLAQAPLPT